MYRIIIFLITFIFLQCNAMEVLEGDKYADHFIYAQNNHNVFDGYDKFIPIAKKSILPSSEYITRAELIKFASKMNTVVYNNNRVKFTGFGPETVFPIGEKTHEGALCWKSPYYLEHGILFSTTAKRTFLHI